VKSSMDKGRDKVFTLTLTREGTLTVEAGIVRIEMIQLVISHRSCRGYAKAIALHHLMVFGTGK